MRRSIVVYLYTVLHFETVRLGFVQCKKSLVHKMTIVHTVQFNSFIDFEWSSNGLVNNSSPYHHTTASLLSSLTIFWIIHCPSNVTQDLSVKITLKKSIFMYFMTLFWHFDIFALVREVAWGIFYRSSSQNIIHILFLTRSIPALSNIWAMVKSSYFAISHFS